MNAPEKISIGGRMIGAGRPALVVAELSANHNLDFNIAVKTLKAMKDAGCRLVFIGAESGSQHVLDLMGKQIKVASNFSFLDRCNRLGIKTWCNIILGYPGETLEDLEMTRKFIERARPTRACGASTT